ncbi:hypothetical protein TB2_005021 [Malus domestica]
MPHRKGGCDLVRRLYAALLVRVILFHLSREPWLAHVGLAGRNGTNSVQPGADGEYERGGYRGCQRRRQVRHKKNEIQ